MAKLSVPPSDRLSALRDLAMRLADEAAAQEAKAEQFATAAQKARKERAAVLKTIEELSYGQLLFDDS
jgi:O-succinylbenzoate synthase